MEPLAREGFRAIAFDQPGFGLSDVPTDHTVAYRRGFIVKLMDALGLEQAHLLGHSQAGGMVVSTAFARPERVASVIVLGSGNLLPPLAEGGGREASEPQAGEWTRDDTRAVLEDNLYHRELITPEVLEERHQMALRNLAAFRQRQQAVEPPAEKGPPLWQRLVDLPVPLLMLYGAQDRGAAAQRAALMRERYPQIELHLIEGARHLVQWDAPGELVAHVTRFLKAQAAGRATAAAARAAE
jgi:4,5:9,10-diseco-3-hydroxy-5,9,17-trioxoandrosta-1(10),2-diene-4-oate hydrolase